MTGKHGYPWCLLLVAVFAGMAMPAAAGDRFSVPCQLYLLNGDIEQAECAALAERGDGEDARACLAQFWPAAAGRSEELLRELKPQAEQLAGEPANDVTDRTIIRYLSFADTRIPVWRVRAFSPADAAAAALLGAYFARQTGGATAAEVAAARERLRQAESDNTTVSDAVNEHLARWDGAIAAAQDARSRSLFDRAVTTRQDIAAALLNIDGYALAWSDGSRVYETALRFRPALAVRPEQYHYSSSDYFDTVMLNAFPAFSEADTAVQLSDRRDGMNCLAAVLARLAEDERAVTAAGADLQEKIRYYRALGGEYGRQPAGGLRRTMPDAGRYEAAGAEAQRRWSAAAQVVRQRAGDWQAWAATLP